MTYRLSSSITCFVALFSLVMTMPSALGDQPDDPGRFFRIVGEITFDGEAIAYDDVIEIYPLEKMKKLGLLWSRERIVRRLSDGSAVMLEVPDARDLWADYDKNREPDPFWQNPSYVSSKLRPPPEFLPEFYWLDNLAHPTSIEAYVSESYYSQSSARIKIVRPFKLEYVAPSQEAASAAADQMASEPPLDLSMGKPVGTGNPWVSYTLLPVDEYVWRKVPEAMAQIEAYKGTEAITLDVPTVNKLFHVAWPFYRQHWRDARSAAYGVPQPLKFPSRGAREGMIAAQYLGAYGDGKIPIRCEYRAAKLSCVPLSGQKGFYIFYDRPVHPQLSLASQTFDLWTTFAVYVRSTNQVYIFGTDGF